jgi:hypothetical protein
MSDDRDDAQIWREIYVTDSSRAGVKDDEGKLDLTLLPPGALVTVTSVFAMGARKYSREGYLDVPDAGHRYFAAARRHMHAYELGENKDIESNLHHFAHAAACMLILLAHQQLRGDEIVGAWRSKANPFEKGRENADG